MKSSVFQIVLLGIFGAVAVAGVLIFALAVGGGNSGAVGPVRIWGTLDQAAFAAVIRAAAEGNTDLSQVSYEQKDEATYADDITAALASGSGPDLFLIRQDQAYAQSALVIPIPFSSLSESQFKDTFIDGADPFIAASGLIAVPLMADPLVLYWNKDILATAGYAKPPTYWDELYPMAVAVTKRSDLGKIERATIALGEYQNISNAKDILSTMIMQAGGTITTRDSGGRLVPSLAPRAGDAGQSTVTALRFYTEFSDPSKGDYTWNRSMQEARQSFIAGTSALYIGYASEEALIARLNPNLNFSVSGMPQIRNAAASITTGRVYGFAIPRTSTNPTGALTAAFALVSGDVSRSLSTALGMPSARRDVLSLQADGNDQLFNKQAIIMRSWVDPNPVKTGTIFRDMIENTVSGSALITEAVTRADQEMAQLLGN